MRHKFAVVAIIQDEAGRFLVTYNQKWAGYTFPMSDFDSTMTVPSERLAIEAAERDLGCRLSSATAEELEYLGTFGHSSSTGEETWYDYWVYSVKPGQELDLTSAPGASNNPPQFIPPQEIVKRSGLTWSTSRIVEELLDRQDAVLAIVTRPGQRETEYLLVNNPNYNGYFFPVTRLKNELTPVQIARKLVHTDCGYRGELEAEWRCEIEDIHFSNRYQQQRLYQFQACQVELSQVDLMQPYNPLELALCQRGKDWVWVTAEQMTGEATNPEIPLSPTMSAVVRSVLGAIPPQPRSAPLRRSEGGIALIERIVDGEKQWLGQWNDRWNAFFFVGGGRESGESFRECTVREVCEELELKTTDFQVSEASPIHLEYIATSRRAGVPTAYTMELFPTRLSPETELRIEQDSRNAWMTERDIRNLTVGGVRPISVTVQVLLAMSGAISCTRNPS